MDLSRELERVVDAVREGGELLRAEVTRPGGPRGADDHADVDDEICALLVERLGAAFPSDAVISEELPERPGTSARAFHVDPHDGTSHFLRGSRDTSISVGLVDGEELVLGVVYAPLASELTGPGGLLVAWAAGAPLLRDGVPWRRPDPPGALGAAEVVLGSPALRPWVRSANEGRLAPARYAGCGSVATRLALVALGEAAGALCLRNVLASWDYCGGQALLRAAGGALLDQDRSPIRWREARPARPINFDWYAGASPALAEELARRFGVR